MDITTAPGADGRAVGWRFDNTYARLPEALFASATPARVQGPRVSILNHGLAAELGLDLAALAPDEAAALFSGQTLAAESRPIAQAYAGHQFGGFTMLGDGRAILLGEHLTPSGRLVDIQLKGPGRTRFSRGGDGRAALGPMLREYIISEAMAALGIPTTRSLAVVTTGEPVYRTSPLKGAILTRVAASHIRVGTFEYAVRRDEATLRALAEYAIARHYPELVGAPRKYLEFLRAVADRQAALVARWMLVGFIHGVLNTDNVAISGETIDYGPCAFMNAYDPGTVFSSIDHAGRYAYGNQPNITQWNLARFAETLLPIIDSDPEKSVAAATAVLGEFPARFERHWLEGMRKKLGLRTEEAGDAELVQSLLELMHKTRADFTNTFRDLSGEELPADDRYQDPDFRAWHSRWQERLVRDGQPMSSARGLMRSVNPAVIPRNHRVEEALSAAEERDDLSVMHRLLEALASPYEDRPELAPYREPPADECGYRTFCGT
ncbi:protein adenylyltransferase SelO [Fimbriiglobus ruber]|uniref:Protein nucleotidyltransferase YdiU n=1 Tax=Fimbriiglobus ruber TaxID=1908690 RepID=A0A225DCJ8_9BACT|nr:YdiU family protein [Fimbriiglobus ruber]OWK39212.1 Selenoprotein O [Fimbriiglobus ruber]